ncbi:MAG: threonine/serine dehydratase [Bryobacteraceae bacterium]
MQHTEINRESVERTERLIRPYIRRTPVIEVDAADFGLVAARLFFKLECLQHAGSFKTRGAFTHLLTRSVPKAGVVAASGGNHGAAVAYAAMKTGQRATIFVPGVASPAKLRQIREYGAELVIAGDRYQDALEASERRAAETGALPIHAYDQAETLLGQATLGLELEQQRPELDSLLVAVGGGGLIGGIAAWYGGRVRLTGVEPEEAPTLESALRAGRPVDAPAGGIAADSLAPRRVGGLMFPLAQSHVSGVTLVTDAAIHEAQVRLWEVLRLATEPAGAAAFAAVLSGRYRPANGERIGILACGANTRAVDFGTYSPV